MSGEDPRLGSTIGEKYRVVRFIAEGGMGAVYEAQHLFVRRRFAVKFLRQELAHRRDVLARFTQEARAAGALEHENIAAVVDFGVGGDGTPYLVMEYLDGVDLAQRLALRGPVPSERAADLVLQAALGVQTAHAANLIHRDLKPQNLFLCVRSDGTDLVKLLDFGVAKLQTPEGDVTRTGAILGTPAYMSPEQARGESTIDERSDIYSLGVILYELLSGRTPHPGGSHNAVIHHIATESILPLTSQGELPSELVDLVYRTLSTDPALRPASATELIDALRPFARRSVWPPSASAADSEAGVESTLPAEAIAEKQAEPSLSASLMDAPERAKKPGIGAAARWIGLALSGVAALLLWSAHRSQDPPPAPAPASSEVRQPRTAPSAAPASQSDRVPAAASAQAAERAAPASAPPALEATASARPRPIRERPRGRPPAVPVATSPAAPANETSISFDDKNPYR